ncbi:MAG: heavy-metal-associated domain-containing protein [Gemmataceae bacterium]|nr:heavy-metal-associated domain-containing protein [Gemmataceae bacterium]
MSDSRDLTLKILGMHCGGCARRVRAALDQTPGVTVKAVAVGSATVALDPARATVESVVTALSRAGYQTQPEGEHAGR